MSKRLVVILDAAAWPSPYDLQQTPMTFDALRAEVLQHPERYRIPPIVAEVDETYRAPMATSVFAADSEGKAFMWQRGWCG